MRPTDNFHRSFIAPELLLSLCLIGLLFLFLCLLSNLFTAVSVGG